MPSASGVTTSDEDSHSWIGKVVTICGLRAKPELNGVRGLVVSLDHNTGRAGVKIAGSGQVMSIKLSNLEQSPVKKQSGDQIEAAPATSLSLTEMAFNNHVVDLKALLVAKADVNQRDKAGNTALILAAFNGHSDCVKCLLDARAWLDATTKNHGFNALVTARARGHAECVALLEEATMTADIQIEPFGPSQGLATTTLSTAPTAPAVCLAIVSTMKQPANLFTWLAYHRERCGVARFYLRLEDSAELRGPLSTPPWDCCVACTFAESAAPDVDHQMNRQQAFVDATIIHARADGMSHLLHIDDDELLYCHRGVEALHLLFAAAPPTAFDLHLYNMEALHASAASEDPFRAAVAFRHRRADFGAYSNGKSIGVLAHEKCVCAPGVHHFATDVDETVQVPAPVGVILHYESATYTRWRAKFMPYAIEHVRRALATQAQTTPPSDEGSLRAAVASGLVIEMPTELSVWRWPWYLESVKVLLHLWLAEAAAAEETGGRSEGESDQDDALQLEDNGGEISDEDELQLEGNGDDGSDEGDDLQLEENAAADAGEDDEEHEPMLEENGETEEDVRAAVAADYAVVAACDVGAKRWISPAVARADAAAKAHWTAWRLMPSSIDPVAKLHERRAAAPGLQPCCYLPEEGLTLLWPFGAPV